jgi:hypothetical protein
MESFHFNTGEEAMGAKPERIRKAQIEGDRAYLSAAGRQGGLAAAAKRHAERDTADMMRQRIDEERRSLEDTQALEAIDRGEFPIDPRDAIYEEDSRAA